MNREIEIQVKIKNSSKLINFLEKNAEFKKESRQIDEYFYPAHRNFIKIRPIKEWLRLRNSDDRCSITYKNWYYDKNGKSLSYCDEYETFVEDVVQFKKILEALNFQLLVKVDKKRKMWVYKKYEVAVDKIKGLGNFVEIEYIGKNKNIEPKKILAEMISFLKKINCGKIERNYLGYPWQLLFPKEVKHEIQ